MSSQPTNNGSTGATGQNGMNEHVDYKLKDPSAISRFLYKCAGADEVIIRSASYYDHMKYIGIGGVILATAFLAMLSMGFAMHIIFGNWIVTILIAIIWSLIIFNLDRFIVSAAGKGDGKESIGGMEIISASPRLIMAFFIGLTISAPLETYIFQKEIAREWKLSMKQLALSDGYRIEQENNNLNKRTLDLYAEKEKQVLVQQQKYDLANQEYQDELSGKNTGNGWGDGPVARKKEQIVNRELDALNKLKTELNELEIQKEKFKEDVEKKKEASANELISSQPGFLDQIMMLERLSSAGKSVPANDPVTGETIKGKDIEIYGKAFWPIWCVRLLFILIEVTPVIIKMFLIKSAYDYMQDNISQILVAKQGIFYKEVVDEKNRTMFVQTNYNPERIIAVVEHQNEMEERNAKHAISVFADKQKDDIDKDPGKFNPTK